MIRNFILFIFIGLSVLFFSACEAWDYGEHPQVTAIKKIAEYADSNDTKGPDVGLYHRAGVTIDSADVNVTNTYIKTLHSEDVDTHDEIQDIVDNIETLTAAPNEEPVAVITVASSTVKADEFVYLDAIKSTDSDGEIIKYEWKEGNRLLAQGISYDAKLSQGRHIITLIVTDDDNGTGTARTSVIVSKEETVVVAENKKPVAKIVRTDDNGTITLDGSSSTDSDGTISKYLWKEGTKTLAQDKKYTVNLKAGKHTITLTVTDNDNATATATETVDVK